MFNWFNHAEKSGISTSWIALNEASQLEELFELSRETDVVLFKHSTRCSVSSMALRRLETSPVLQKSDVAFYFLDLIAHREISNRVSDLTRIRHESPQLIVIRNGQVIYHTSHGGIRAEELETVIGSASA